MSKAEVSDEIYRTQDAIFAACGADATMFRPPYGALNNNVRAVSTLDFALWDLDTLDWSNKNAGIITQNIMSNVHDGS
ncbi:polysaccharide deacetylase family protein, partial [Streptococcus parasanguinis]